MLAHRPDPDTFDPASDQTRRFVDAWAAAAYGPGGFWRRHTPGAHFRTAANSLGLVAELVERVVELTGARQVVDVGAGSGELLAALHARRPGLHLAGVDLRRRPGRLPVGVSWVRDVWDVATSGWRTGAAGGVLGGLDPRSLVVATEWLDDLPCPVAVWRDGGWREVVVDDRNRPGPGPSLGVADAGWADRWWPAGGVAEIGRTRDLAWADLVGHAVRVGGSALMIDYGHEQCGRPGQGSLAGYREGHRTPPAPDREANLTAHVAVDALRAAGERVGAATVLYAPQSAAVPQLMPSYAAPPHPHDPLAGLVRRNQRRLLGTPSGWGAHWWLWQTALRPGRR